MLINGKPFNDSLLRSLKGAHNTHQFSFTHF
nr:MAG TPA: hypothetical protein [Caudoviricetes sp.]